MDEHNGIVRTPRSLSDLLAGAGIASDASCGGAAIPLVTADSRTVVPGALFVAIPGFSVDGLRFVPDALARGACAIVAEHPVGASVPTFTVPNTRRAFALLCRTLEGDPSASLHVIGVTGTDGKTSITTMISRILEMAGKQTASFTTVEGRISGKHLDVGSHVTTPEADVVERNLAIARDAGATHVALETSSHALALHRVYGVHFTGAVYSRITSEHLDLHGTREDYRNAKALLLRYAAAEGGFGVLNADDDFGTPYLSAISGGERLTYSVSGKAADLRAHRIESTISRLTCELDTPAGGARLDFSHLRGAFMVENALAALGAALLEGVNLETALNALSEMDPVTGRMEEVRVPGQDVTVLVDFAHTEAAFRATLPELSRATAGRFWVVFGSAGERDTEKRSPMGRVAGESADVVVVTDEDPRRESRDDIADQIARGAEAAGKRRENDLFVIHDREEAIRFAVTRAEPGDCILLAGKGHESTLTIGKVDHPWNEFATARKLLLERYGTSGNS